MYLIVFATKPTAATAVSDVGRIKAFERRSMSYASIYILSRIITKRDRSPPGRDCRAPGAAADFRCGGRVILTMARGGVCGFVTAAAAAAVAAFRVTHEMYYYNICTHIRSSQSGSPRWLAVIAAMVALYIYIYVLYNTGIRRCLLYCIMRLNIYIINIYPNRRLRSKKKKKN